MKISATIITLNEEHNIGACLESLDWAAEIVVVDSGSSDRTREICLANPRVRFHLHPWEGFGRQKNIAAQFAANDWIFNIDADERVSPQLRAALCALEPGDVAGFKVARENYFGTRRIRYCGWYPDYNLRLYDRSRCAFSERAVHEAVACPGPAANLEGNLLHYSYADISDYVRRMDRYSTLAAEQMLAEGRMPGGADVVFRPVFTFFKMFILKRGFLDRYDGLVLSCLYSCYTFCKYAKALEMKRRDS